MSLENITAAMLTLNTAEMLTNLRQMITCFPGL